VTVDVERVVVWPGSDCAGEPEVHGAPRPAAAPEPQAAPKKGTAPRLDATVAAKRLARLPHVLLGWRDADGFPAVMAVEVGDAGPDGVRLSCAPGLLPPGGRRAGLMGHAYKAKAVGLRTRLHTGWVEVDGDTALYAPHTAAGFRAPSNKTLLLIANGLLAKQGLRKARRAAAAA
jgi:hypothetical protein